YARHAQDRDDEAILVYQQILTIQPEDRDTHYNLGVIFWKKEDFIRAEEYFKALLTRDPDDAEAILSYATLLARQKKHAEAINYFNQYLEIMPQKTAAYLLLADCYTALEQYLKALDVYEKVLILDARLKDAWYRRAEILLTKAEDPDKGYTSLEQALDLGFNDRAALADLVKRVDESNMLDYEKTRITALLKKKNLAP
ncbi:MAG: tetratricopeptide repeat protein, partial [Oligoflexia bacterium]|nr:tetratricopeptide repeat protein [Oligoflexia bacterium]